VRDEDRITGWWVFAGALLMISGILNIIWGIAALGESHFFVGEAHFIFSDLKTWGWITLILGVLQLIAMWSIFGGGEFGRWFAMITAGLVAIDALLDIAAYPFWSLAVFSLSIIILYQLAKPAEIVRRA
jgi:hypothetical protein